MKNLRNRREKGITLIALVVTIVVLIILATISINAVIGQDGIIQKAKDAKTFYENKESEEKIKMQLEESGIKVFNKDKIQFKKSLYLLKELTNFFK